MSAAGLVLLLILVIKAIFNRGKDYKFFLFRVSIILGLFVNVGYFYNNKFDISYNLFIMIFYVGVSIIITFIKKDKNIINDKATIISSVILILVVIAGYINLLNNNNMAPIVPMNIIINDVAFGKVGLSTPIFGKNNIGAFMTLVIFCMYCYFSIEYFKDKVKFNKIVETIKFGFHLFFIFMIIEAFMNNVVSSTLLRSNINNIFGLVEKTYILPSKRFGLYTAFGLFSEPSYISTVMIYYSIIFMQGFKDWKEKVFFLLSFICLILSGSSTGILLIPFFIIVLGKELLKYFRKNAFGMSIVLIVVPFMILAVLYIVNMDNEFMNIIRKSVNTKIHAYINGDIEGNGSGYARSFGNSICYNVLKYNPILGVGLGSTRGFGMIPSVLANMGLLGSFAYCYFVKYNLNLKITKSNIILLFINIAYVTSIFSVWYIYIPAIIAMLIPFNKNMMYREFYSMGENYNGIHER